MSTPTANYGWPKPTVGDDTDIWGGELNSSLDGIDSIVHGIDTRAPTSSGATPLMNGTADPGAAGTYAREGHIHPTDTSRYAAANPSGFQTAAQVTSAINGAASTTLPLMDGAATVGGSGKWSDGAHVHPSDTSRAPVNNPTFTGTVTLPRDPTTAFQAATKNYVDAQVAGLPTAQTFLTSGSGTYTPPAGVKWLRVRMVGGGGGGVGGGTSAGSAPGVGGNTIFGPLTAGGGQVGTWALAQGGSGGTVSGNAVPGGITVRGGVGGSAIATSAPANNTGGNGGSSALGGAGGGGNLTVGTVGGANTGGGGGGGSGGSVTGAYGGAGGGSGAFIDVMIAPVAASYPYTVGAGGNAGAAGAGTGSTAGGAGGSGGIWVEEHYGG